VRSNGVVEPSGFHRVAHLMLHSRDENLVTSESNRVSGVRPRTLGGAPQVVHQPRPKESEIRRALLGSDMRALSKRGNSRSRRAHGSSYSPQGQVHEPRTLQEGVAKSGKLRLHAFLAPG